MCYTFGVKYYCDMYMFPINFHSSIEPTQKDTPFGWIVTTPEVVMEVSGLSFDVIQSIAREHGVDIEDKTCRCLDGQMLMYLKDAYVRKIRAYFNNSRQNISQLFGDELILFVDFCKTFKKRKSKRWNDLLWADIDVKLLHEHFIRSIKELSRSSRRSCLDIILEGLMCGVESCSPRVNNLPGEKQKEEERHREFLLKK